MIKKVYDTFTKAMIKIVNYKEIDKNGNERKCAVRLEEAEKHPGRYKIYEYKHPNLKGKKIAYDPEIVKKFTNTFKKLCSFLPQSRLGIPQIPIARLVYDEHMPNENMPNAKEAIKDLLRGETFIVFAKECGVIEYLLHDKNKNPGFVSGTLKKDIPTIYDRLEYEDRQKRKNQIE